MSKLIKYIINKNGTISKAVFENENNYWKWSHWKYSDTNYYDTYKQAKNYLLYKVNHNLDNLNKKVAKLNKEKARIVAIKRKDCKINEYSELNVHDNNEYRSY